METLTTYRLIEFGNYGDSPEHVKYLKQAEDAFGNKVEPENGYRLLTADEVIQMGDKHFDIYGGWCGGGESYHAKNGHHAFAQGRWTCWERLINHN